MEPPHLPSRDPERLICAGRVVLPSSSLFAIWLDPTEPAKFAQQAYLALAAYLGYALLLLPLAWTRHGSAVSLGVATHLVDLLAFSFFIYFTEGPTSPFFFYFTFALLSATLRWQWRGTLWTALAMLAAYIGIGLYAEHVLHDPAFDLNRFTMRSVYLAVVAMMLGYLSAYEGRVRAVLAEQGGRVAALEERLRLARDLHDGVLQWLAGIALGVETARRQIETDPKATDRGLIEVQRRLGAEQRELRAFITQLRSELSREARSEPPLAARLEALRDRIEGELGLRMELSLEGADASVPDRLAQEACYLIQEALVNAVRHAHAVQARVRVCVHAEGLAVDVANDGRGYPFCGRYDLAALYRMQRGPRSLMERVSALAGDLVIDAGSRLEITLPLG